MKKKIALITLICLLFSAVLPIQGSAFLKNEVPIDLRTDSEGITNSSFLSLKVYEKTDTIIINASDYVGANDTERLQAALDDVPPEGAIVLISGVWTASGLIAKSDTTILGTNGIMQRPDNTTAPFITFENRSNFAILNLTFDGRGVNDGYGIEIKDGKSFVIQNNTFLNIKKSAAKIEISLEGVSEIFTITDNIFVNCHNAPVLIFGCPTKRNVRRFTVLNNTIVNGTVNGKIGVAFSAEGLIINNTVMDSEFGIATRCVSNITIKGNTIRNAKDYGIYLGTQIGDNGTNDVTIECNMITDGYMGIARYYCSYPVTNIVIKNNQFVNNSLYDILADFPAIYINNTITSAAKLAIKDMETVFIGTRTITNDLILPGDINSDLKIDIRDVAFVAIAFGCVKGSTRWDSRADIIKDDVIDIRDIAYVSRNYGLMA